MKALSGIERTEEDNFASFYSNKEYKKYLSMGRREAGNNMVSVQNSLAPFCCVLGKDTLWHFPLLGRLDKQC